MNDSILTTIKKLLGLSEDYDVFDTDVMIHINSAFLTLNDLAVGPAEPFVLTDKSQVWSDFFSDGRQDLEAVKSYVYLKVKLQFDPPGTSFAIAAMEKMVEEYAWRLNVRAEGSYDPEAITPVPPLPNGIVYNLTGGLDFPESAPVGSYGLDSDTGDLWRKT